MTKRSDSENMTRVCSFEQHRSIRLWFPDIDAFRIKLYYYILVDNYIIMKQYKCIKCLRQYDTMERLEMHEHFCYDDQSEADFNAHQTKTDFFANKPEPMTGFDV